MHWSTAGFILALLCVNVQTGKCYIVPDERGTCRLHQANVTVVQVGPSGLRCQQTITTVRCIGGCESAMDEKRVSCTSNSVKERAVILSKCEPGVGEATKTYTALEPSSCSCMMCNPKLMNCEKATFSQLRGKRLGGRLYVASRLPIDNDYSENKNSQREEPVQPRRFSGGYDWRKPMSDEDTRMRLMWLKMMQSDYSD